MRPKLPHHHKLKFLKRIQEVHLYLTELDNCNKIILELEKELGLTPLAKKKIDGGIVEEKEDDPFTAALAQLTLVKS